MSSIEAALVREIEAINASRREALLRGALIPADPEASIEARFGCGRRLAVYGSLAPGRENNDVIAALDGTWMTGTVEGHLEDRGWGAGRGYPGLRLVAGGPCVRVQVLTSGFLPDAWGKIDAFEGEDYCRVLAAVRLEGGDVTVANIYELRE